MVFRLSLPTFEEFVSIVEFPVLTMCLTTAVLIYYMNELIIFPIESSIRRTQIKLLLHFHIGTCTYLNAKKKILLFQRATEKVLSSLTY